MAPRRKKQRSRSSEPVRRPRFRLRLLLVVAVLVGGGWTIHRHTEGIQAWLDRELPIRRVAVVEGVEQVEARELAGWIGQRLQGGFLTADLQRLRRQVERRPWIRAARLQRQWPDTVVVAVTEHRPAARWSPEGENWWLVDRQGEVFKRHAGEVPADLPRLRGPRDRLDKLRKRRGQLRRALSGEHRVSQVGVSQRGAWSARINGSIWMRFGSHRFDDRVRRLTAVQEEWGLLGRGIRGVDLRYPDGLAVAMAENKDSVAKAGRI